jgi:hypothetical protein
MMRTGSLTVEQRKQQVQRLKSLVTELYQETEGRGKWWQAVKRAVKLTVAIHTATGARKVALGRQLDALAGKYSA